MVLLVLLVLLVTGQGSTNEAERLRDLFFAGGESIKYAM